MGDFFHKWRRKSRCVTLVVACFCGCAQSLSTNHSTHSASEANTVRYQVDIKKSNGNPFRVTGRKIEYRLKDVMVSIGDGELCVDGQMLATLKESDLVTIEDSGSVALNGVRVWPDDDSD